MKPIKRILAPTDFSAAGKSALDEAIGLARTLGATVTLFNVYELPQPIPDAGVAYGPDVIDALAGAARGQLEHTRDELRQAGGEMPPIEIKSALGNAHEAIVEEARRGGYQLVVMGTHGRTGLRHLLLGSVAERVVRMSPTPVLTVHPATEAGAPAGRAQ